MFSESGMCSEAGMGSEHGMCSEAGMSEGIDMVLSGTESSGRTAICLCPGVCWPTVSFSFMIVILGWLKLP